MKEQFMVYVSCITFNQSQYIKDALDGFCKQQTNFPFVCAIFDDASTDGEPEVIRHYLVDHFNIDDSSVMQEEETNDYTRIFVQHKDNKNCFFLVVFLKYNHYQIGKNKEQYVQEWVDNAKYIAFCEGDDYWINPLKLQKQVDAMSNYSNVNICAHASIVIDAITKQEISVTQRSLTEKVFSTEEVIMGGGAFVNTNSILYRNKAPIYNFYKNYKLDYFCQINYSINAGLLFLPNVMSAYRDNVPGSLCTVMDKDDKKRFIFIKKMISTLTEFDKEFNYKYTHTIAAHLLIVLITTDKDAKTNRHYFTEYKRGFYKLSYKQKIKVILCSICPSLFRKKSRKGTNVCF